MQLKHLEYFVRASQYPSLNEAAKNMYISQPSLSAIIVTLEKELGYQLFTRSKAGIQLTVEGQTVLPFAKQILDLQSKMLNLEPSFPTIAGKIIITAPNILCETILLELILQISQSYPNISISLRSPKERNLIAETKKHDVLSLSMNFFDTTELFTLKESPLGEHVGLISLFEAQTAVFMNSHNPLSINKTVKLNQLIPYHLVSYANYNTLPHQNLFHFFDKSNILLLPSREAMFRMIALDPNYVGLFSSICAVNCPQVENNSICMLPLDGIDSTLNVALAYPMDADNNPLLKIIVYKLQNIADRLHLTE